MFKQVHVIFRGRVQGVGFRFSVRSLAENLNVKGWVSNLPDGTVEMVAEQDEPVLQELLGGLDREFGSYITGRDMNWLPAAKSFQEFSIR